MCPNHRANPTLDRIHWLAQPICPLGPEKYSYSMNRYDSIGNMKDFLVQTNTHAITGFLLAAVQKLDARWIRGTLTFGGLKQQLRYSKGCEYHVAVGNGNEVSSGILVSQTLTPFFPNNPLMSFQTCNLNTSPGRWLWKLPWYRRWRTQVQRRGHDSTIRRNGDTIYNMI